MENKPSCYTANNNPYPLCKGNDKPLYDCKRCNLYGDMLEEPYYTKNFQVGTGMENAGTVVIDNLENYLNGFSLRNFKTHVDPEQLKELLATQAKLLHHLWQPKAGDYIISEVGGEAYNIILWTKDIELVNKTKNFFTWLPSIGDMINILDSFNPYSLTIQKSKITHECLIPMGTEEWEAHQQGTYPSIIRGKNEDDAPSICDCLWELVKEQLVNLEDKIILESKN